MDGSTKKLANYLIRYLDQGGEMIELEQIFDWNHKGVLLKELLNLFSSKGLVHNMSDKEQSFFKFTLFGIVEDYQKVIDGELSILQDIDNGALVLLGLLINHGG